MKKLLCLSFALLFGLQALKAQKFGYIDSEYILSKLPDYAKAQSEINRLSSSWQVEIEDMQKKISDLYGHLDREQMLLTDRMRKERLDTIQGKEKELAAYQKKIFGFEGLFFLKKQELVKPLQDEVFEAVKKVAKSKKLAIVFDKAGDLVMVYTNPTHDYTDFVLEELGLGDPNDEVK